MFSSDIRLDGAINGNRHLGHIILECFRKRNPDDICQIDAATDEKETFGSVLNRSILLARSFRKAGLVPGDVMALSGRNHLNLRIPYYAALMHGLPVAGIDSEFKYEETKSSLAVIRPKIAFCEYENYEYYTRAIKELGLTAIVVTFNEGECSMAKFMEGNETENEEYRPSYFDTDKVYAWLLCTSGTTGVLKFAALKHEAVVISLQTIIRLGFGGFMVERGQKTCLNVSPVQWITSTINATCFPLTNTILVQSSRIAGIESYIHMFNKYKPSTVIIAPSLINLILKHEKHCDMTSLDIVGIGGSSVYKETILLIKSRVREDTKVCDLYGTSETQILVGSNGNQPLGSCGTNTGVNQLKLIDVATGAEVTEPYKHGELWAKGPTCFAEYYNNPKETAASINEDGWFKTGDIMYRDDQKNFYFVDRMRTIIQYRYTRVIPSELEEVIIGHPDVLEVCVAGVPHKEDGERPAACVVRRPGGDVTAQEIKDLVADKLSEAKLLRGGVFFVDSLPKTSNGKVMRQKVQSLVKDFKEQ